MQAKSLAWVTSRTTLANLSSGETTSKLLALKLRLWQIPSKLTDNFGSGMLLTITLLKTLKRV